MQDAIHRMSQLFDQLGLDGRHEAIERFIFEHPLPRQIGLTAAPFWDEAQRRFLQEAIDEDSDWCELVDQLDAMLHAKVLH